MSNICPSCQSEFTCEAKAGSTTCWCMQLPPIIELDEQSDCFCPTCLKKTVAEQITKKLLDKSLEQSIQMAKDYQNLTSFTEYIDYTIESGNYVFTKWYHLKRGACCDNGCRNCAF